MEAMSGQYWQEHVTKNPDPELAEINRLALERIRYFEKKLEEEYGLHLRTGIEIEFFALDKKGALIRDTESLGKKLQKEKEKLFQRKKGDVTSHRNHIKGTLIKRIYGDSGKPVIEYTTGYIDFTDNPKNNPKKYWASSTQALDVEKLVRFLSLKAPTHSEVSEILFVIPESSHFWEKSLTAALQVNMSLWSGDKNFFYSKGREFSKLAGICATGLLLVQNESVLLAANFPESYVQLHSAPDPKKVLCIDYKEQRMLSASIALRGSDVERTAKRIENRLSRADSNPLLAILQTISGMYYALNLYTSVVTTQSRHTHEYPLKNGKWLRLYGEPFHDTLRSNIESHKQEHAIFHKSALMKELLGEDLHGKISSYYSDREIEKRRAAASIAY